MRDGRRAYDECEGDERCDKPATGFLPALVHTNTRGRVFVILSLGSEETFHDQGPLGLDDSEGAHEVFIVAALTLKRFIRSTTVPPETVSDPNGLAVAAPVIRTFSCTKVASSGEGGIAMRVERSEASCMAVVVVVEVTDVVFAASA